jgi:hypothetical protein
MAGLGRDGWFVRPLCVAASAELPELPILRSFRGESAREKNLIEKSKPSIKSVWSE